MKKRSDIISMGVFILRRGLYAISVLLIPLLWGCSVTKYLKPNESLYTGAEIRLNSIGGVSEKKRIINDLTEYIAPKPNKLFLGMRPGVWFYYRGNPEKKKGLGNFLKKTFGRPPVLLSEASPQKTAQALMGELNNTGYFGSRVESSVVTKDKKSKVIYNVDLHHPFHLVKINEDIVDSTAHPEIRKDIREESILKKNQRFRLKRLEAEQQRIEEVMTNHGYYYFDDRYVVFNADTTVGKYGVDLDLKYEEKVPAKVRRRYRLRSIKVYPNYSMENDSLQNTSDTVKVEGFTFVDNQHNFKPKVLTKVINIKPDSIYSRVNHEYSLTHIMSLKAFKYASIKYTDAKEDSNALNASIYLTPLKKNSIRVQLQGVSKSNNFVGPGIEFTFANHNTFLGAELLQLKIKSAYEVQISRQQSGPLNAFELGAEASLSFPRFVAPFFKIRYYNSRYLPQSQIKLGYDIQQRLNYFRLTSFNAAYGYTWRESKLKTHELYPIDISYVELGKTSASFDELLKENPTLANSFKDQFIPGTRYSFTYNTQLTESIEARFDPGATRKYDFFFKGTIDVSGNLLHAVQNTFQKDGNYELFGNPYSQYIRADIDFRYYLKLTRHGKLATRFIAGWGYAYGNSTSLPYVKQFSIGGSNSLRAFPARSVGPGTYNVRTDTTLNSSTQFIDQRGDIKLEGNAEYRFDIIKSLKGAFFVDAGNIWLRKEDSRAGSEFHFNTFLSELAVGTGAGLRFDFDFFVLRFDVAFPLRKPYLDPGQRWVINKIDFSDSEWRRQNIILNIAIGYPF